METTQQSPGTLDAHDPLKRFRQEFHIPLKKDGSPCLYFCGNSLGLQPRKAREYVDIVMDDWQHLGVEAHFDGRHPWMPYHEFLTPQMAQIVGAKAEEVVVMNTLTTNLHLLMVSFYRPKAGRFKILMESDAFPSDRYALESQIRFHGYDPAEALLLLKPRPGETLIRTEDIETMLEREGQHIALVLLGGVNYYTGQLFPIRDITAMGHRHGCTVGFDLAHAAGNIDLKLHDSGCDFAVWCTYKYLNGSPGSLGGVFVHERHGANPDLPRFAGWWGHNKEMRFNMRHDFDPIKGAEGWQLSNPPILPMAAMRASLDLFEEAGMDALRRKSVALTGYLESLLHQIPTDRIRIITPIDPDERGCQLSIQVRNADRRLYDQITAQGVIADWREPDVIRVAPVPLYNTFSEVQQFAEILSDMLT